ncbi:hypothetical protein FB566_2377 [Stackebrandtia endophytica]|uniref:Uncharacterized protein n=1 Tax=Stackebrandtia endophytica TaxID=1496996 RepID=A0A543AW74_9ACTN|nr:hypothetical protein [Stackebrandtia endophytica]TQL76836.1 hypothetical protein FB566_2377 [Stackebrandtia endophytica]
MDTTTATAMWHDIDWDDVPSPDSELASIGLAWEVDGCIHSRSSYVGRQALGDVYTKVSTLIANGYTRAHIARHAIKMLDVSDPYYLGAWHRVLTRLTDEPNRIARSRR